MAAGVISRVFGVFFEYDTPRIVHIRSKKVGVINRFLQLCIIGYVIGYAIVFKKGYQEFDAVQGAVTTKLKGVAQTFNLTGTSHRIWDVADYVVPPQENNAFFVATNYIITENQQIGTCLEDINVPGANCTDDEHICKADTPLLQGNGFMTGNCNASVRNPPYRVCEVKAWCPTEDGNLKPPNPPALEIAKNFTVFIKNNIEFPKFGVKRRNILGFSDDKELRNCHYTKDHAKYQFCPIFLIGDIVNYAGSSDFTKLALQDKLGTAIKEKRHFKLEDAAGLYIGNVLRSFSPYIKDILNNVLAEVNGSPVASYPRWLTPHEEGGGVIQIVIDWDCNLDYDAEDCVPEYSFHRLDSDDDFLSKGYNFRYAHYYKDENGTETRTLYKAYGIKFIVTLQGQAGKFNLVPLVLNIGSGLAILSIATLLCDFVVLYVLKAKAIYREKKYLEVVGDDAYKPDEARKLLPKIRASDADIQDQIYH